MSGTLLTVLGAARPAAGEGDGQVGAEEHGHPHGYPFEGPIDSSVLVPTVIPQGTLKQGAFRAAYLAKPSLSPPPVVAVAEFVPPALVAHLLRKKKDVAVGEKFRPGDAISNMEGAIHSLVTPVVSALMQGDYKFAGTHVVPWFGAKEGWMLARPLIVSCLVQPDFEFDTVMFELIRIEAEPLAGRPLPSLENFQPLCSLDKRDPILRFAYERSLKQHIVYYTVGNLVGRRDLLQPNIDKLECVESCGELLSLAMLRKILTLQLRGEFKAISRIAPHGFVYTWDPPSIFTHCLNSKIINRIWVDALAIAIKGSTCRMVAFNDYADKSVIPDLKQRLDLPVTSKSMLFPETLVMPESVRGCALVIHNNSDGFGQNIETEAAHGSLDGAIGSSSSTSASLLRDRPDLLENIISVDVDASPSATSTCSASTSATDPSNSL